MPFPDISFGKGRLYKTVSTQKNKVFEMQAEFSFQNLILENHFQPNNHSSHLGRKIKIKFWVKRAEIGFCEFQGGWTNVSMNMDAAASSFPFILSRIRRIKK